MSSHTDDQTATENESSEHLYTYFVGAHLPYFWCGKCGENYTSPQGLSHHLKWSHPTTADMQWKCCCCPEQFSREVDLREHEVVHWNDFHFCTNCKAKFPCKTDLKDHEELMHSAKPSTQLHNSDAAVFDETDADREVIQSGSSDPVKFYCDQCGELATSEDSILKVQGRWMYRCYGCSRRLRYQSRNICDVCDKQCKCKADLSRHQKLKHSARTSSKR